MGAFMFFSTPRFTALPIYLPIFFGLILAIILALKWSPEKRSVELSSQKASIYPAVVGFIFYLTYVPGLVVLAQKKIPVAILLAYALLNIALFYWFMKIKKWLTISDLTIFGIGDYCAVSFTAILIGFNKGVNEIIITGIIFIIIFVLTIFYINKLTLLSFKQSKER
jgi:hypothetical protein